MKILRLSIGMAIFVLILGAGSVLFSVHRQNLSQVASPKVKVMASFYPLYFFAKAIGGEKIEVTNLTPPGMEPHDFEPTPQDLAAIERADLLILNGGGLEAWADKASKPSTLIVQASRGIFPKDRNQLPTTQDPHVWLDPVLAKVQVKNIVDALISIDADNREYYLDRQKDLEKKLDQLHASFATTLVGCKQAGVVTSHAVLGLVAARYGFSQISLAGLSPDEEPTPQDLARITDFAKSHKIKYIFFETLISPKLSMTIAKETGGGTLVFDPLEGLLPEDQNNGQDYFSIQKHNLENLRIALECP